MNNPLTKLYQWQINSGQLDGWTSYHLMAGLFIAKVAQWLGVDLWAVLWVLIIGVLGKYSRFISRVWKKPMVHVRNGLGTQYIIVEVGAGCVDGLVGDRDV